MICWPLDFKSQELCTFWTEEVFIKKKSFWSWNLFSTFLKSSWFSLADLLLIDNVISYLQTQLVSTTQNTISFDSNKEILNKIDFPWVNGERELVNNYSVLLGKWRMSRGEVGIKGVSYTIGSPCKVLMQGLRIWGIELYLKLKLPGQTYKVKFIE